jgi:kynurenine formamidase
VACGRWQDLDIRPATPGGDLLIGDILLVRAGFVESYDSRSASENAQIALRPHFADPIKDQLHWAGLKQEKYMLDWLHDCYFAAVGGDAPSFERWPTAEKYYTHEYILALWGIPLEEMVDLEKLSRTYKELNRWSSFSTSSPSNCPGGVSSHVNATAIF